MTTVIRFSREHYHLINDMWEWCTENFGQGQWAGNTFTRDWSIETVFGYTTFVFKDDEQALIFKLKWGGV